MKFETAYIAALCLCCFLPLCVTAAGNSKTLDDIKTQLHRSLHDIDQSREPIRSASVPLTSTASCPSDLCNLEQLSRLETIESQPPTPKQEIIVGQAPLVVPKPIRTQSPIILPQMIPAQQSVLHQTPQELPVHLQNLDNKKNRLCGTGGKIIAGFAVAATTAVLYFGIKVISAGYSK